MIKKHLPQDSKESFQERVNSEQKRAVAKAMIALLERPPETELEKAIVQLAKNGFLERK